MVLLDFFIWKMWVRSQHSQHRLQLKRTEQRAQQGAWQALSYYSFHCDWLSKTAEFISPLIKEQHMQLTSKAAEMKSSDAIGCSCLSRCSGLACRSTPSRRSGKVVRRISTRFTAISFFHHANDGESPVSQQCDKCKFSPHLTYANTDYCQD